eukprot:7165672-Pyramimonas_sp.AAC.1
MAWAHASREEYLTVANSECPLMDLQIPTASTTSTSLIGHRRTSHSTKARFRLFYIFTFRRNDCHESRWCLARDPIGRWRKVYVQETA